MTRGVVRALCCVLWGCLTAWVGASDGFAFSRAFLEALRADYPADRYLLGIAEADETGQPSRDRRMLEVMARRELAAQIRVDMAEKTVDIMCSHSVKGAESSGTSCRDEVSSLLESQLEVTVQGARIVDFGKQEGRLYCVSVLERAVAGAALRKEADEAIESARDQLAGARNGDGQAWASAREHIRRARAIEMERSIVERTAWDGQEGLERLEREIDLLTQAQGVAP